MVGVGVVWEFNGSCAREGVFCRVGCGPCRVIVHDVGQVPARYAKVIHFEVHRWFTEKDDDAGGVVFFVEEYVLEEDLRGRALGIDVNLVQCSCSWGVVLVGVAARN